jgi:hypothetical protein
MIKENKRSEVRVLPFLDGFSQFYGNARIPPPPFKWWFLESALDHSVIEIKRGDFYRARRR